MKTDKVLSEKILVLGVDAMEPRFAKKMMDAGRMPNLKQYVEKGCQREDLTMLGSQPTVTPPQWTTLACGCNPNVHTITQFSRHDPDDYAQVGYNIDSRLCQAEPIWDTLVEAGKKTCVFHWPGSAWPPTNSSPNLIVIDGTSPGAVGSATCSIEHEEFLVASEQLSETRYVHAGAHDGNIPCVIDGIEEKAGGGFDFDYYATNKSMVITPADGSKATIGGDRIKYDAVQSAIKNASGWANAPEDAKEFFLLTSGGLVRRPVLILTNEQGVYDHIAIYRSKKETQPMVTLYLNKMVGGIKDESYKNDKKYNTSRNYMLLECAVDGSKVRMFMSAAYNCEDDTLFYPKSMHKALTEVAGPIPPSSILLTGGVSHEVHNCMMQCWDVVADWYSKSIHYLLDKEGVEVLLSHFHSVDNIAHTFIRLLKEHNNNTYTGTGHNAYSEDEYEEWLAGLYEQTDRYLGTFLHYVDEGWTVIITSDHGQVCPQHEPIVGLGDMAPCLNVSLLKELGYTVLKKDENGNELREIDWSKTRAVQQQGNDIFLNIKGRGNKNRGIVEPDEAYELEEQIMTDLYGYKDPKTGKRVVQLALRKRDAILLGYGGPTAGDIFFATAEGFNYDHCDSLSTCWGERGTSASPIFVAAGKGIKKGETTERIIRQIDLAPTISALTGVRFPAQCEGSPAFQIFEGEK